MKRALIVTTIGGFLPQFEMNDARILQAYGLEVQYASNFRKPVYELNMEALHELGVKTHPISVEKSPLHVFRNVKAFFQVRKLIDQEEIDLIHCHNPMGGVIARLAAATSRRKPKVIYTAHGFHFYEGAPVLNWLLYYPAERFLAHFTDALITINREDERLARCFNLKSRRSVFLIHGVGVDMTRFSPKPEERDPMRERLCIPKDAFHIVTAAELNQNKNQITVIRAIAKLKDPLIYYSICGKGPCWDELQNEIDSLGLHDRVRLLGYRYDMADVLQSADCFAFPSHREGLGIAAVEALACGIPVVAADNRGTREYMRDRVNGLVCEAADPESFAAAIHELKSDRVIYEKLKPQCRDSAASFAIEDTDKKMRSIYREVIHRHAENRTGESYTESLGDHAGL